MARSSFISIISWTLLALLAVLLVAKLLASAISVGCGLSRRLVQLRAVPGHVCSARSSRKVAAYFSPALAAEHTVFMLAGMGAVAAAIIGAPLTMVFLVLEATGDFQVTIAVVIAVTVASTIVRILFGYSFATWRFHLRGLSHPRRP